MNFQYPSFLTYRPGQSVKSRMARMMLMMPMMDRLNQRVLMCHSPSIFSLL